jgi:hypothetical protein
MGTLQSVLILSAILFASSGSNSTAQTRSAATDLGDTTWQLVKFRSSDGTVLVLYRSFADECTCRLQIG